MTQNQADTAQPPMVVAHDVQRSFGSGERAVHALRGVSFEVERGGSPPSRAAPAPARRPC